MSPKRNGRFRHSIKTAKVQFNSANHQQSNMDKRLKTSALRFGTGRKNETAKNRSYSLSKELLVSSEDVKSDRDFIKAWHRISKSTLEDKYRCVIFLSRSLICLHEHTHTHTQPDFDEFWSPTHYGKTFSNPNSMSPFRSDRFSKR